MRITDSSASMMAIYIQYLQQELPTGLIQAFSEPMVHRRLPIQCMKVECHEILPEVLLNTWKVY